MLYVICSAAFKQREVIKWNYNSGIQKGYKFAVQGGNKCQ